MNQHPSTPTSSTSVGDEIGILDLLVVIAENIRLLIIGPLVAGLIALGVAFVWPKTYASEAYLKLAAESAAGVEPIIKSPVVIDKILALESSEEPIESRRREFLKKLRWESLGSGSDLIIFSVKDRSPQRAQELNRALLEAWIVQTLPRPDQMKILKQRLDLTDVQLATVTGLIDRLAKETPQLVIPGMQNELATSLAGLQSQRNTLLLTQDELQRQMTGVSRDVILVPPSLPTEPSSPKKGQWALYTGLIVGVVLLVGVVLAGLVRISTVHPDNVDKLRRIANALRLRRKTVA